MKSLSDAAFFRTFDALVTAGNAGLKRRTWHYAGADWRRDRYSMSLTDYSFVVDVFAVSQSSRPKWTLLSAKEYWWGATEKEALRDVRWSRPTAGRRADVLAWFRTQERALREAEHS
ncbi:MAG: hypothetical protein WD076_07940, partial [Parvularculaceae bacterium]